MAEVLLEMPGYTSEPELKLQSNRRKDAAASCCLLPRHPLLLSLPPPAEVAERDCLLLNCQWGPCIHIRQGLLTYNPAVSLSGSVPIKKCISKHRIVLRLFLYLQNCTSMMDRFYDFHRSTVVAVLIEQAISSASSHGWLTETNNQEHPRGGNQLSCMCFDWGRKLKCLEGITQTRGKHANSSQIIN